METTLLRIRAASRILAYCLALALCLCLQPAKATTLGNVVRHSLFTNPELLSQFQNVTANIHRLSRVVGQDYPQVDFDLGGAREYSENPTIRFAGVPNVTFWRHDTSLVLTQNLFSGWRIPGQIHEQHYNTLSAHFQYMNAKEATALRATEAYMNILRNRRLITLAIANVKVHSNILYKVTRRFDAGAGRIDEIHLARSRLALARSRLRLFRGELLQSEADFRAVTGYIKIPKPLQKPPLPFKFLPKDLKQALDLAFKFNPSLHAARTNLKSTMAAVVVSRSRFLPNVNLRLSASDGNNLDGIPGVNRDAIAGLVLDYNLINGGSDLAAIREATARREQARDQTAQTYREVEQNERSAWYAMVTERKRVRNLRNYVVYSKHVVEDYIKQFVLGKRAFFNVLDAENELFLARVEYTNSGYDSQIDAYTVLANMGHLAAYFSAHK